MITACDQPAEFKPLYTSDDSLLDKMKAIVTHVYGGADVELSTKARNTLKRIEKKWVMVTCLSAWPKLNIR